MGINLNSRERIVLASIFQYPSKPDIEIATSINMKHSTFATIKKRLRNKGYFFRIYLPNFAGFGAEMFGINIQIFANDPRASITMPKRSKRNNINEYLESSPNLLFSIIESNLAFTLSCYANFRQFQDDIWRYDNAILESDFNSIFQHELQIPIAFSTFPRFLDYSKSITRHLEVKSSIESEKIQFHFEEENKLILSNLSRTILEAFLESPGRTPKDVSEITGKSRTTTSRWLKKFLNSGLITPRYIPNVEKIGYKIILFSHYSISSSKESDFDKAIYFIDDSLAPIMLMRSEYDTILAALFRSYDSAKEAEQVFISQMNEEGISYKTKYQYLLSLPHTITKFNFMNKSASLLSQFRK
ncbi:MAG: winged helix-turn-helix transcriptional regulator [Candidatus Hodarchaeales archaeon]|jgi:DNA-binding MarR family transcriptional regulator